MHTMMPHNAVRFKRSMWRERGRRASASWRMTRRLCRRLPHDLARRAFGYHPGQICSVGETSGSHDMTHTHTSEHAAAMRPSSYRHGTRSPEEAEGGRRRPAGTSGSRRPGVINGPRSIRASPQSTVSLCIAVDLLGPAVMAEDWTGIQDCPSGTLRRRTRRDPSLRIITRNLFGSSAASRPTSHFAASRSVS
jgi:hypothetical protein